MKARRFTPGVRISFAIAYLLIAGVFFFLVSLKSDPIADLALTGANIYTSPHEPPISSGTVLIKDGKILAVGKSSDIQVHHKTPTIDCTGLTMTSGFWNCHVHLMENKWLGADSLRDEVLTRQMQDMFTQYGFTYIFDLATLAPENLAVIRDRISRGTVKGPRLLFTGIPIAPRDASPFYISPLKLAEPLNADECAQHVSTQFASGADAVKLWSSSPTRERVVPMALELIETATRNAHRNHKQVFAHPSNLEGARLAARGGVDILAHVAADDRKNWDSETLNLMLSRDMALIPTLKLHKWDLEQFDSYSREDPLIVTALLQVGSYHEAGGEILFGTDVGYMTDYSPEDEYLLMHEAGLDFNAILETLTVNPARRFGLKGRTGKIAPGFDADLVLLKGDPAIGVANFVNVKYTFRAGVMVYSSN